MTQAAPRRAWIGVIAVVLAVLVGVGAAAGAWFGALSQPATYRASAYVVVVPTAASTLDQAAGLFDSLSKGQVVATAATILARPWWTPGQSDATITAGEVTPSSVIKVSVSSGDPAVARRTLDETLFRSTGVVNTSLKPFEIRPLPSSEVTAERVGLGTAPRVAIAGLAGLLACGLTAYAALLVTRRRHGRR